MAISMTSRDACPSAFCRGSRMRPSLVGSLAIMAAVDGAFLATLPSFGAEADCVYAGPTERAGVYEVRASKPGYQPATVSNVRVAEDECHVIPVQVTISLSR